jgi:hypothetical protein
MGWGTRIAILYLSFVALIVGLAFVCFGEKVDLEYPDYYAKELAFQGQLDATNNTNALAVNIKHVVKDKSVELSLPKELLSADFKGTAKFFRPSDSSLDRIIILKPSAEGKQVLTDAGLIKGVYKLQLSFFSNGKNYYKEDVINFR